MLSEITNAKLEDIYIPTRILLGHAKLTKEEFLKILVSPNVSNNYRNSHAAIIRGAAGSGKSIFMRRAFLDLQKLSDTRIPVLLELRNMNTRRLHSADKPDLSEWAHIIRDELNSFGDSITVAQIEDGLKHGLFIIMLDGVDELKPKIQMLYERLILELSKKYGDCPILIAGRPMRRMLSWQDFSIYDVAPLSLRESLALVEKANTDQSTKTRFVAMINAGIDPSYTEFLQSPLLLIIMIITFSDSGRLSDTRHEFYEDAFNALWLRHDIRKERFERQKYTDLLKQDFLRLLNAFAAASYFESDIVMRGNQFTKHFRTASSITQIDTHEDHFRDDLLISTSLMVEDGNFVKFSHRTFQEYFASLFIVSLPTTDIAKAIDLIAARHETDQVLGFIFSISPEAIERHWILPRLDKVFEESKLRDNGNIVNYAKSSILDRIRSKSTDVRGDHVKWQIKSVEIFAIVRELYDMKPSTHDLHAAFDASVDIASTIEGGSNRLSPLVEKLWKADRGNFFSLRDDLKTKYNNSRAATKLLLG